ncbi:putative sex-determining protein fem-1 [Operophtera brumata]|uniref:Putative sex-determining protein fem-1 n=1 Tax=Operophtera brumata TaxID=104452 RepID=A0A0L7LMK1_OPEBR|nr:putative sex-determining protein fem-1 [Operophtera brumata]
MSAHIIFDQAGAPPLWCAAAAGHLPLVKLLVRAGANVNSTTRTHSTPLRAACFDGHFDIVKFLVENGAGKNPESQRPLLKLLQRAGANFHSMTQMHSSHLRSKVFDIFKFLVENGTDVNRKSVKGNTALHDCAESGSLVILKLLLGQGASMDVDSYGKYLLTLNADVNRKSVKGNTALHDCAESGSLVILKLLLGQGASMDVDSYGKYLLTLNADVNRKSVKGNTALHDCAESGSLVILKLLLGQGASMDVDSYVKYLLTLNADVNRKSVKGNTALHDCAESGSLVILKLLLGQGASMDVDSYGKYLLTLNADVNRKSVKGNTALHDCAESGSLVILKLLLGQGASMDVDSYGKYLLTLNADVNRKSVKGNTALHDCAESGSLVILKLLLGQGASMDVDSYGMTPLLAASVTGHTHIVQHLIHSDYGLVTRQQRIDALELLGATYVDKRRDMTAATPSRSLKTFLASRRTSPAHPDTSYYVRYRGAVYADAGRFQRCRQLWHHALDMQRAVLPPLSPLTQSSLYSFAELFTYMLGERARPPLRGRIVPPVTFEDIEPVFQKALSEMTRGVVLLDSKVIVEREQTLVTLQRVLVIALQLAALLARLLDEPECTDEVSRQIHKAVYTLVKLDIRLNPCPSEVVRELLSHGAHIDTVNYDGETPEEILKQSQQSLSSMVNPLRYTSLKCLAARTVKNYRLPYRHVLPQCLHATVITH